MITQAGMSKITNFFDGLITKANYTIGGATKETSIYRTVVNGNTVEKWVYLSDADAGSITRVRLLDSTGEVIVERPDSVQKTATKGVLYIFKFTISEV
jgi:hypothetical protein